jgi:hypothetical protein
MNAPQTENGPQASHSGSPETVPAAARSLKNSSNFFVVLFGVIMLAGLLFLAWIGSPPQVTGVGEAMPAMDLQPLIDTEQALDRDSLTGKLVVFHFWGSWSAEASNSYATFAQLAQQFADHPDVQWVSVASSAGPDYDLDALREKAEEVMEQVDARMPTYADPAAMTRGKLALLLPNGTFSYPTTLLVDRDGVIVETLTLDTLARDSQRLVQQIESRL